MNLFVLVSTGQKVANLPPVLEHAKPGDHVLWIESDEARRGNWTEAPRSLLEDRGLMTTDTIAVSHVNDPVSMTNALRPFAEANAGQYESVFLVANGGQKLSPVGLLFGLESLSPRMLYGDDRPAVHSLYPTALDAAPEVRPYTRHDLDLPDILQLNGYTFATHSSHSRIWPDPLPSACMTERYGQDAAYTCQLHADHQAWSAAGPARDRVPFADVPTLVSQEVWTRWDRTVDQVRQRKNPQHLQNLYNSTLNLDEVARVAQGRQTAGATPPADRIGHALERAVARRVREWLERGPHLAVRSVWLGVQVARANQAEKSEAEFDVLIVLTNGILIHLECKSAEVNLRDLDVNTHRLRQAASQLARLALVIPCFTQHVGELWAAPLHTRRVELEARFGRNAVLPFTWVGQPSQYTVPGSEPTEVIECPAFEDALDQLLRPYRPR